MIGINISIFRFLKSAVFTVMHGVGLSVMTYKVELFPQYIHI